VAAVRRRRRDGELACYACWAPAVTSLVGLVRVAGSRWRIEEGFQQAKTEVGLDHHQVRRWPGWYRHVTLALLAMPSWSSPAPRPPVTTQRGHAAA
jgi:SRSO17 transposase